ncbi:MAG: hypothetical protein IJX65_06515 [Alistipes sp.]|nr:hypothetical protein [Alistipes sp.]
MASIVGLIYKLSKNPKKRNFFRIQSICPKCGAQIRRAYLNLEHIRSCSFYNLLTILPFSPLNDYIELIELEEQVKANPTKPYIYDIECPNCGFMTKKEFTYIQIKSKEYK